MELLIVQTTLEIKQNMTYYVRIITVLCFKRFDFVDQIGVIMLRFKRYVWNLEPKQSQTWKLLHDSRLNVNGSNQYIFYHIWKVHTFIYEIYSILLENITSAP